MGHHLDTNQILTMVSRYAEQQEITYHIARKVCDFIKEKWHGKKINKRLATDVLKLLNGEFHTIYYEARYGMFHLKIDRKDKRAGVSMLICYEGHTIIDAEKVEEYNQCYLLNLGCNKDLKEKIQLVPIAVTQYNKAIETLEGIKEAFQDNRGMSIYPYASYFDFKASEEVKLD
ncbi:MAG: hypothetical protein A2W17_04285 [Planctomycetes bacterium RBG_16_41_13]|nr:MAG: hypothetical protein A2W17_04285 [Planctomycetes bacterium RBG_16_41_13]